MNDVLIPSFVREAITVLNSVLIYDIDDTGKDFGNRLTPLFCDINSLIELCSKWVGDTGYRLNKYWQRFLDYTVAIDYIMKHQPDFNNLKFKEDLDDMAKFYQNIRDRNWQDVDFPVTDFFNHSQVYARHLHAELVFREFTVTIIPRLKKNIVILQDIIKKRCNGHHAQIEEFFLSLNPQFFKKRTLETEYLELKNIKIWKDTKDESNFLVAMTLDGFDTVQYLSYFSQPKLNQYRF